MINYLFMIFYILVIATNIIEGKSVLEDKLAVQNKNCFFEEGATMPTFSTDIGGGKVVNISCTTANCNCIDGKGTGFAGCHSCCCGIRTRVEACKVNEPNHKMQTNVTAVKEEETSYFILSISLAVLLVVVIVAAIIIFNKQRKQINKLNVQCEDLNASLRGFTANNTPQQSPQGTPQVNIRDQYNHHQQQQSQTISPPTNIEAAAEFSSSAPFINRIENPVLARVRNSHSQGSTRSNTPLFNMSANLPEDVQPSAPVVPIDRFNDLLNQPHTAIFGVTDEENRNENSDEQNRGENTEGVIEENHL